MSNRILSLGLVCLLTVTLHAGPSRAGPPAGGAAVAHKAQELCAASISRTESREDLPKQLLHAIALVESGRPAPDDGKNGGDGAARIAWPWTIHAEGNSYYLDSKAQAAATVRRLQERGVTNIDVGCMQVNLHYHGRHFASIEDAFDPSTNVAYAARFLKQLYDEEGSWPMAVARYHSSTLALNVPYRQKVYRTWRDELDGPPLMLAAARTPSGLIHEPLPRQASRARRLRRELRIARGGGRISSLRQSAPAAAATDRDLRLPLAARTPLTRAAAPGGSAGKEPRKYSRLGAPPKTYKSPAKQPARR